MGEHTPLPWCTPAGKHNAFIICSGDDPDKPGEILMVVRSPVGRRTVATDQQVDANVALMVKAVNAHEMLVKALTEAITELECSGYYFDHPSLVKKRAVLDQVRP